MTIIGLYKRELSRLRGVLKARPAARVAAAGFVLAALLLILAAAARDVVQFVSDVQVTQMLDLTEDRGLPEVLGYAFSAVTSVLLLLAFLRTRLRSYLLVSLVFAFALVDDALRYHENASRILVRALGIPGALGLRPQDLGEMLGWAIAAAAFIPVAVWCLRDRQPADAGVYLVFGSLVLVLASFAVGVDAVHMMMTTSGLKEKIFGAEHLLTWAEDGGELLTLALTASCAVTYYEASRAVAGERARVEVEQPVGADVA